MKQVRDHATHYIQSRKESFTRRVKIGKFEEELHEECVNNELIPRLPNDLVAVKILPRILVGYSTIEKLQRMRRVNRS